MSHPEPEESSPHPPSLFLSCCFHCLAYSRSLTQVPGTA